MSLENYTDKQILEELERRKLEKENSSHYVCIGIIDEDGAESLVFCEDSLKFSTTLNSLRLRARFNSQRNPIVYSVKLTKEIFNMINSRMLKGECHEMADLLKSLSNFKSLGY